MLLVSPSPLQTSIRHMIRVGGVPATIFDSLQTVVDDYADGDSEKQSPDLYVNNAEEIEQLNAAVRAIPYTVRAELTTDSRTGAMQLIVRLVRNTFTTPGVHHPLVLTPRLRVGNSQCPPIASKDASFMAAAGLPVINGQGAPSSMAFVKVDGQRGAKQAESPDE